MAKLITRDVLTVNTIIDMVTEAQKQNKVVVRIEVSQEELDELTADIRRSDLTWTCGSESKLDGIFISGAKIVVAIEN